MAFSYDNFFSNAGKFIKSVNQFRDMATGDNSPVPDLGGLLDGLETQLDSVDRHDILSGLNEMYQAYKDTATAWASEQASKVTELLTHRETVIEELEGLGNSPSVQDILTELYRAMVIDSEDVLQSTVTLGSPSYAAANVGDGLVLVNKVLDGVSVPISGSFANPHWAGANSQLATSETMTLTCVADSYSDGLAEGSEQFSWKGQPRLNGPLGWRNEGSGLSRTLSTANAASILSNKDFESWSSMVPTGWTLDAGTAGTHVVQETSSSNVYRGSNALKVAGDGSQASIQISQTMRSQILKPLKRYLVSCFVKGEASTLAGTLTIQFESPSSGYSAGGSEKIEMNSAALSAQTSYGHESFYINMPAVIPDDMELVVKVTGTLTNAKNVWIDALTIAEVEWGNGINAAVIAGATPWVRGDRITFTVANDDAGVFQTFFRRWYKSQLPSVASSPSQAESKAT